MNGAVSVMPYTCVTVHPSSPSTRSIVAAAGGAPAVITCTPAGAPARTAAGAFARPINTVGAAHIIVTRSAATVSNTFAGSTLRRHTWTAPAAVTTHTYLHPL